LSLPEEQRLDLARKLYQRSIWNDVTTVSQNRHLRRPLVVELDPTSFCDLSCPECISGPLLNQRRFTTERLGNLAREMVELGVRAVILIGGGEPLLHPGTKEVIRILGSDGIRVGVTTNGTMIHRHLDVLAEFATWTRVSVDAGSAGCYARFRPSRSAKNAFEIVINNMKLLADKKQGAMGFSYLLIARKATNGTLGDHNFDEIVTAALLAKSIGCDYFELKPAYDLEHYLIDQPRDLLNSLIHQIDSLFKVSDKTFSVIAPNSLRAVIHGEPRIEPKDYDKCTIAELRTLITPQGAFICPYHRGDSARKYGDPTTESIQSMWNSSARREVVANTNPSRDCQFHCIRHPSNLELTRIGNSEENSLPIEDYDVFI